MSEAVIWGISIFSILAVLSRPFQLPEWIWAVSGALLLVVCRQLSVSSAFHAVRQGVDVYFFLIGMMLLSEQAREEGLFGWVASVATQHARGSAHRLFVLLYGVGILVTVFLSNDATAVVLTPAVYAAVKKSGAKPLPHLFACAFIANAASFVLPISNPANLVVFNGHMPSVFSWVRSFGLASVISIVATFCVLRLWFAGPLKGNLSREDTRVEPLSASGKGSAYGLGAVALVLMAASSLKWDLGLPTFISALLIVVITALKKSKLPLETLKHVSWGVVPLVAGLFVIVEAMNQAGALSLTHRFLTWMGNQPPVLAKLGSAFGVAFVSNVVNNLPVGLVAGMAVQKPGISEHVRNAVLVGVDLGPNLSVTGSLATLLWLMALRREGEIASGWEFLKVGLVAMPLALALSTLVLF